MRRAGPRPFGEPGAPRKTRSASLEEREHERFAGFRPSRRSRGLGQGRPAVAVSLNRSHPRTHHAGGRRTSDRTDSSVHLRCFAQRPTHGCDRGEDAVRDRAPFPERRPGVALARQPAEAGDTTRPGSQPAGLILSGRCFGHGPSRLSRRADPLGSDAAPACPHACPHPWPRARPQDAGGLTVGAAACSSAWVSGPLSSTIDGSM